ncbi:hypothetical protein AB1Y20_010624 [Prymnesium parvum]|uniref:Uncharacterized protein n=1 Tax=Prymnesium parvum TaxID=97485 RepID=A0AB34IQ17_PRYPA
MKPFATTFPPLETRVSPAAPEACARISVPLLPRPPLICTFSTCPVVKIMRTPAELEEVAARLLARDQLGVASVVERLLLGCNSAELSFVAQRVLQGGKLSSRARLDQVGALRDALVASGGLVALLGLLDDCRMLAQVAQAVCLVQRSQTWDEETLPKLRRVISDARRAGLDSVDASQLPRHDLRQLVAKAKATLPALDLVMQTAETRLANRRQGDMSVAVRARRRTQATQASPGAQTLEAECSEQQLGEHVVSAIQSELHEVLDALDADGEPDWSFVLVALECRLEQRHGVKVSMDAHGALVRKISSTLHNDTRPRATLSAQPPSIQRTTPPSLPINRPVRPLSCEPAPSFISSPVEAATPGLVRDERGVGGAATAQTSVGGTPTAATGAVGTPTAGSGLSGAPVTERGASAAPAAERGVSDAPGNNSNPRAPVVPAPAAKISRAAEGPPRELWRRGVEAPLPDEVMRAAAAGDSGAVQAWVKEGGAVNARWSEHRVNLLMVAAGKGNTALVEWLLHHGADVNLQQKRGTTALMMASVNAHVDVVCLLLDAGAQVDLRSSTKNGQSEDALGTVMGKIRSDSGATEIKERRVAQLLRDHASGVNGRETLSWEQELSSRQLCPSCYGCLVEEANDDPSLVCDGGCCGRFSRSETRWSCEGCDFDICAACAFGRKKRSGRQHRGTLKRTAVEPTTVLSKRSQH